MVSLAYTTSLTSASPCSICPYVGKRDSSSQGIGIAPVHVHGFVYDPSSFCYNRNDILCSGDTDMLMKNSKRRRNRSDKTTEGRKEQSARECRSWTLFSRSSMSVELTAGRHRNRAVHAIHKGVPINDLRFKDQSPSLFINLGRDPGSLIRVRLAASMRRNIHEREHDRRQHGTKRRAPLRRLSTSLRCTRRCQGL